MSGIDVMSKVELKAFTRANNALVKAAIKHFQVSADFATLRKIELKCFKRS